MEKLNMQTVDQLIASPQRYQIPSVKIWDGKQTFILYGNFAIRARYDSGKQNNMNILDIKSAKKSTTRSEIYMLEVKMLPNGQGLYEYDIIEGKCGNESVKGIIKNNTSLITWVLLTLQGEEIPLCKIHDIKFLGNIYPDRKLIEKMIKEESNSLQSMQAETETQSNKASTSKNDKVDIFLETKKAADGIHWRYIIKKEDKEIKDNGIINGRDEAECRIGILIKAIKRLSISQKIIVHCKSAAFISVLNNDRLKTLSANNWKNKNKEVKYKTSWIQLYELLQKHEAYKGAVIPIK